MHKPVEIQDIEALRRQEGIEDVDLRKEIRQLKVGDFVNLSVLTDTMSCATLLVRITSIQALAFRGKPAAQAASARAEGARRALGRVHRGPHSLDTEEGGPPMSGGVLDLDRGQIRGTDSNSLLRLYDLAQEVVAKSSSQQERARADKALQHIAKELKKRQVPFSSGPAAAPKAPAPNASAPGVAAPGVAAAIS